MARRSPWRASILAICLVFPVAAAFILAGPCPFRPGPRPSAEAIARIPAGRVILITLDGVREGDVREAWTKLLDRTRRVGFAFGLRSDGEDMWVSNSVVRSFAGYETIYSGKYNRHCYRNDCPRPDAPTFVDELLDSGEPAARVAVVSSWSQIERASETRPRALASVALDPLLNGGELPAGLADRIESVRKRAQIAPPAWPDARSDSFTWEIALDVERALRPRFLHVALLDTDSYGHLRDFPAYRESLADAEKRILELLDEEESRDDAASFVITTDHGRGEKNFPEHGFWEPTSARIWTLVLPSRRARALGLRRRPGRVFRQVDLRPTIELLLGLDVANPRDGDPLVIR